ncbi:MAG TPA: hypothetical protein VH092_03965, partial [Urbifossiella sp.]|nr:hypothetical protein [Urbifossiella sp.]
MSKTKAAGDGTPGATMTKGVKTKRATGAARVTRAARGEAPPQAPSGLVRTDAAGPPDPTTVIELVRVVDLIPAQINNQIYKKVDLNDPALRADAEQLRETIARRGIMALDALVLTLDGVIVSG